MRIRGFFLVQEWGGSGEICLRFKNEVPLRCQCLAVLFGVSEFWATG